MGTSNVVERDGRRFTVRPEKVHIAPESSAPRDGFDSETGRIREVVYLGMVTRFLVDLDAGGRLVAVRQNLEACSQDALNQRGNRVRLEWHPGHTFDLTQRRDSDEK